MLDRQSRYDEAMEVWQRAIAHYQALGVLDGVARLYARSARAAWMLGGTPRGLRLCREGMAAVAGAPESPDYADLLHETARACYFNGLPDEASSLCRQALEMAERLGAVRVQAEALTTLGMLPDVGYEEAVSVLTQAVELAESTGLLDQAARAHNNLGSALTFNDPRAAREHFLRAAELDGQRGEILGELYYACNAAHHSLWLGDLAAVEEALPSLWQLLQAVEEPGLVTKGLRELEVMLLRFQGELAEAIEGLRSFRMEAREAGDLQALANLNARLATAYIWEEVGDEEEVEAILREMLDLGEQGMGTTAMARILLSVRHARQGRPEAARRSLTEAREQAVKEGELVRWGPYLSWAEGDVALAEARWPEALAALETAVDTLGRRKQRWHRARMLIDWAEAHLARGESGDQERALELLREAEAEFEAMGAPLYAKRARGRLESLGAVGS
jgi:tetratricopeptide (TPR) repeat protein